MQNFFTREDVLAYHQQGVLYPAGDLNVLAVAVITGWAWRS